MSPVFQLKYEWLFLHIPWSENEKIAQKIEIQASPKNRPNILPTSPLTSMRCWALTSVDIALIDIARID